MPLTKKGKKDTLKVFPVSGMVWMFVCLVCYNAQHRKSKPTLQGDTICKIVKVTTERYAMFERWAVLPLSRIR